MDFEFPEELAQVRRTVRGFIEKHLRKHEADVDEADFVDPALMAELRREAVRLGLYAHNLPPEFGGGGLGALGQVVVAEELGSTSIPLAKAAGFLPELLTAVTDSQRPWFLDPLVAGEKTVCYAMTEPDAGSDLGAIKTRAKQVDGGWLLNGAKQFVSHVSSADFIVVLAVTDPQAPLAGRFTLFILDKSNPGFRFIRSFRKMGWRGSDFAAFALDDCRIADDCVLGGVNQGFGAMMKTVNSTRVQLSGVYNGVATEVLARGVAYAKERRTFGARLADHQAIQFRFADIDCELAASRLLSYQAADAVDRGSPSARIAASRAKLYASEMAGRAVDGVLQVFGAAGYTADLPIERFYRDARAFRIGEGSSEMQRLQIARHLLR